MVVRDGAGCGEVQYHAVGPAGARKQLSMEEGRRWERIDESTGEQV